MQVITMSLSAPTDPIRMASLARRERQKAETRQAILDAARALFVEHGVAATTMRGIAAAIGYTPTAIYPHVRDKDALLLELCLEDFGAMARALHAIGTIPDPIERLRQMAHAYVGFAVANPQQYRLLFMTELPDFPLEPGSPVPYPGEGAYRFLVDTVAEAAAQQRLRAPYEDPAVLAQLLWSGVHGLATLWFTHFKDPLVQLRHPSAVVDAMCDALMCGALRPAPQEVGFP